MQTTYVDIIGPKHCRYTFRGVNLAELRRAELYRLAKCFDLANADSTKNDMLGALISKLKLMNAEQEITDMIESEEVAEKDDG